VPLAEAEALALSRDELVQAGKRAHATYLSAGLAGH
jgi:hypothetical protein